MSTFTSLFTSASGMHASRRALEVIANNIANANTPGYKRQQLILLEGNPRTNQFANEANLATFTGTGVHVAGIRRMQDAYLDNRIAEATHSGARWNITRDTLQSVQALFAEPGTNGVSNLLDQFWNKWSQLASTPDSVPARADVLTASGTLADRVKEIYSNLRTMQQQLDVTVRNRVEEINRIAADIAEVNEKIVAIEIGGAAPNELLNRREELVEQLSKIVSVRTYGQSGGDFMLSVNGVTMVQGMRVREMGTTIDSDNRVQPVWAEDNSPVWVTSGELKGILDVRDGFLKDYLNRMDVVVETLVTEVNTIHKQGFSLGGQTGLDFFTAGSTAANFSVNTQLMQDPTLVAASASGLQSNPDIAQQISDLRNSKLIGEETISQSYRSLISKLGGDVSIAERSSITRDYTLQQLVKQRESLSGVSLDDEMLDIVRFQQSFMASARVFEATNYVLETLLKS